MGPYPYITCTLVLTAYGQLILKARALAHARPDDLTGKLGYLLAMFTDIGVLSGIGATFLAGVCWTLALERTSLGLAYPFMALSFVVVPLSAAFLFAEPISVRQVVGMCIIVTGVAISTYAR